MWSPHYLIYIKFDDSEDNETINDPNITIDEHNEKIQEHENTHTHTQKKSLKNDVINLLNNILI